MVTIAACGGNQRKMDPAEGSPAARAWSVKGTTEAGPLTPRQPGIWLRGAARPRRPPDPSHEMMQGLSPSEARLVRKQSTLLRVADSLDRSHHQPVRSVRG